MYLTCLFSFLQIQCILLDIGSNIATPRSSARESHMRMHFFHHINSKKLSVKQQRVWSYLLCCFFERENKTHYSADCRLGNLDRQIYSGTPTADQLHHSCELLGQVLSADVADIVRPGCTADSIIPKRSACLCHHITESWAV